MPQMSLYINIVQHILHFSQQTPVQIFNDFTPIVPERTETHRRGKAEEEDLQLCKKLALDSLSVLIK